MKKIKSITFHRAHNYGAFLQSYALQNYIISKGHDAEIIDYINPKVDEMYKPFYNPYGSFLGGVKRFIRNLFYIIPIIKRYNIFNRCIKNDLKLTKSVYNIDDVLNIIDKDDILITGSDQVWNKNLTNGLSDLYTLNFSNNYKISYAASVGNNDLLIENKDEYKNKLSSINSMSVRENSTSLILNNDFYKFDSKVVLDPVFLLNASQWEKIVSSKVDEKIDKKYIFSYMLKYDSDLISGANYLSKITNLPIVDNELRNKGYKNRIKTIFSKGPWHFLYYLINAEYVITQSFHATVFSIIFHKKVFVISHKNHGVRTDDLLKKFNLESRKFSNVDDLKKMDFYSEPNWSEVDNILNKEINDSKCWLNDQLK